MNKEQEAKFDEWYEAEGQYFTFRISAEKSWSACLDSNGIGDTTVSAAPEWVIDMMRTGKPVRCKVWDDGMIERDHRIIGYRVVGEKPYIDNMSASWDHAEPISAWRPKDGEVVLYNAGTDIAGIGTYIKGRVYHGNNSFDVVRSGARLKPFNGDESKIGTSWSEI